MVSTLPATPEAFIDHWTRAIAGKPWEKVVQSIFGVVLIQKTYPTRLDSDSAALHPLAA